MPLPAQGSALVVSASVYLLAAPCRKHEVAHSSSRDQQQYTHAQSYTISFYIYLSIVTFVHVQCKGFYITSSVPKLCAQNVNDIPDIR